MPFLPRRTPRDATLTAVERMALTSPHLLSDLGFFRDPQRDTGGNTAWVRGHIEVQVNVTLHRAQARRISLR